jgi:hypothetical protein
MSAPHPEPRRIRGMWASETYEERFPRYAHNAGVTAETAKRHAAEQRRAAGLHRAAAVNASQHGDPAGADLYDEMSKAALDAADALEDIADLAREAARHYGGQAVTAGDMT